MTIAGSIFGWKMIFLRLSPSSRITLARPTSEPVPEVVGTPITGAMPFGSTRVHQSSRSSKSQIGRVWPAISAIAFAVSSALPPPNAITPSWPPACRPRRRPSTFARPGSAGRPRTPRSQAPRRGELHRVRDHRQRPKPGVRDQQRSLHAERPAVLGQLDDAAGAELVGRVVPVAAQGRHLDVSGCRSFIACCAV